MYTPSGVGLFHSELGAVKNNSVIVRNGDDFGSLYCLSASTSHNIGRWLAPDGQDLRAGGSHPFLVIVGGEDDPGFVNVSVSPLSDTSLDGWQGVYSCVIPDERGDEQIIHLGIHTSRGIHVHVHVCVP